MVDLNVYMSMKYSYVQYEYARDVDMFAISIVPTCQLIRRLLTKSNITVRLYTEYYLFRCLNRLLQQCCRPPLNDDCRFWRYFFHNSIGFYFRDLGRQPKCVQWTSKNIHRIDILEYIYNHAKNVSSPSFSNRRIFLDTCKLQHLIEKITLTHIGSNHGAASTNYIGTGLTRKSFVSGQAAPYIASHVRWELASIK